MALNNETIKQRLSEQFPELSEWSEPYGLLSFRAPANKNIDILRFLFDDPQLRFKFLTDLTGVHYPERNGEELAVVYHIHNMADSIRLRMTVYVPVSQPDVPSATAVYASANWMERETFDFFGINFLGHPNLTRILNVDEMQHFPMRKEFQMEDPTRTDKDDEMFGRGGTIV